MTWKTALALAPLALAVLALASEHVRGLAARRPLTAALLVPACWLARAAEAGELAALPFALVLALSLGTLLALSSVPAAEPRLRLQDLAAWLVLWIPLDLRWSYALWPGHGGGYEFWALAVSYLALLGWACPPRALPDLGHRAPFPRDVLWGLGALLAFGALAIPAGLATGFVKPPSLARFDGGKAALEAVGLVLAVALPEEIFFRGVLDRGLRATLRSDALALAASSLAFGLMHWPRREHTKEQLTYCAFATVAGVFYGLAYRRSGGLPAAVLAHAAVDWIWLEALQK